MLRTVADPNVINYAIVHRQGSHLSDLMFSACLLVKIQLCLSIFEPEKNLKKTIKYCGAQNYKKLSTAFLLHWHMV